MKNLLAVICFGLLSSNINAATVTYNIAGYIDYINSFTTGNPYDGILDLSSEVSGSLSYDDASIPTSGYYLVSTFDVNFNLVIGPYTFNQDGGWWGGVDLGFLDGALIELGYYTQGFDTTISESWIWVDIDEDDYYPDAQYIFDIGWDPNGTSTAGGVVAAGGALSLTQQVSTVPLPTSLFLFLSGIVWLLRFQKKSL